MAINFETFEKAQQFLRNEMSPDQNAEFLREVKTNQELADHLRFESDLEMFLNKRELNKYVKGFKAESSNLNSPLTDADKEILNLIVQNGLEAKNKKQAIGKAVLFSPAKSSEAPKSAAKVSRQFKQAQAESLKPYRKRNLYPVYFGAALFACVLSGSFYFFNRQKNDRPDLASSNKINKKEGKIALQRDSTYYAAIAIDLIKADVLISSKPNLSSDDDPKGGKPIKKTYSKTPESIDEEQKAFSEAIDALKDVNYNMAAKKLSGIIAHTKNPQLAVKSKWYLALVYLKTNKPDQAIELLKAVEVNTFEYQFKQKAITTLEKLR